MGDSVIEDIRTLAVTSEKNVAMDSEGWSRSRQICRANDDDGDDDSS